MGRYKLTTEDWIERAKEVHDDRYDYSLVEYKGVHEKVDIICKKHGLFRMEAGEFVNRRNECPKCANEGRRVQLDDFVRRATDVHGGKYTYRMDESDSKFVFVTCPVHGEFRQNKFSHLKGCGCPKCADDRRGNAKYTQEELNERFIEAARGVHGDAYDYSESVYVNSNKKVTIICRKHGRFETTPSSHIHANTGCPECTKEKMRAKFIATREHFLKRARKAHGDKYEYGEFSGMRRKITITCPIHGKFEQTADLHCRGEGCPKCNRSLLENEMKLFLDNNLIKYDSQKKFSWLKLLSLDFYLPEHNVAIECQGEQHYRPIELFGGEKAFNVTHKNDIRKQRLCAKHGITLLYYTKYNKMVDNVRTFSDMGKIFSAINIENDIKTALEHHGIIVTRYENGRIWCGDTAIKVVRCVEYGKNTLRTELDNARTEGKRLIQVYDYEWLAKRDMVLDKLTTILGKSASVPMNARDCTVREAEKEESKTFFDANHIQGNGSSTVTLCGEIDGNAVGMMSFKKLSRNGSEWELTRFACSSSVRCRGLAGKLFSHFVRNYAPSGVKSFADLRWTDPEANVYTRIGFKNDGTTPCDYMYAGMDGIPRHKFGFRKDKLSREHGFDASMTEAEMCESLGLTRIWNCGLIRYKWTKTEMLNNIIPYQKFARVKN